MEYATLTKLLSILHLSLSSCKVPQINNKFNSVLVNIVCIIKQYLESDCLATEVSVADKTEVISTHSIHIQNTQTAEVNTVMTPTIAFSFVRLG